MSRPETRRLPSTRGFVAESAATFTAPWRIMNSRSRTLSVGSWPYNAAMVRTMRSWIQTRVLRSAAVIMTFAGMGRVPADPTIDVTCAVDSTTPAVAPSERASRRCALTTRVASACVVASGWVSLSESAYAAAPRDNRRCPASSTTRAASPLDAIARLMRSWPGLDRSSAVIAVAPLALAARVQRLAAAGTWCCRGLGVPQDAGQAIEYRSAGPGQLHHSDPQVDDDG